MASRGGPGRVYKFIIIGDTSVGKTCLLLQFSEKQFRVDHAPTIGVEFAARNVNHEGTIIKLHMWDTAGLESFAALTSSYYRGACAALVVYDVTCRDSFLHVQRWLQLAREHCNQHLAVVLVGNKADIQQRREVSPQEGMQFAQANELMFMETSATTGQNVEEAFMLAVRRVYEHERNGLCDYTASASVNPAVRIDRPEPCIHTCCGVGG